MGQFRRFRTVGLVSNLVYGACFGLTNLGTVSKLARSVLYAFGALSTQAFSNRWPRGVSRHLARACARYLDTEGQGYAFKPLLRFGLQHVANLDGRADVIRTTLRIGPTESSPSAS